MTFIAPPIWSLPKLRCETMTTNLVHNATRRVIGWREFDESVAAATDDPAGGVAAANRAVQLVLGQLGSFCTAAASSWRPPPGR